MNKHIKKLDKFLFDDIRTAAREEDFIKFHTAWTTLLGGIASILVVLLMLGVFAYVMYECSWVAGFIMLVFSVGLFIPVILFRIMVACNKKNN